ncbi:MAG: DNA-directed RNA polymerase subunit H [Candidatus Aenigmatarchaeota archaeon]
MSEEIDIFQSALVPKHEILSEADAKLLLEQLRISESQLPKIKVADPAVKALGAKVGDILRITRKSPTAGECLYYRIVVP